MKKNLSLRKLLGIIAMVGVVSSTSVSAFASDVTPVENSSSSELETGIQSRIISRDYNNFPLQSVPSFSGTLQLTTSQPYGKVHYYNNTGSDVTITVVGEGSTTIGAYSGGSVVWTKSAFKSSYYYNVTSKSGNLNGTLSVAKATDFTDFQ